MTRLAIVPLSLYAGKNTLSPGGRRESDPCPALAPAVDMDERQILSARRGEGKRAIVGTFEAGSDRVPPEARLDHAARLDAELPSERWITDQGADGSRQRGRVAFRNEQPRPAIGDHGSDAARGRGHQRRARSERLKDGVRQPIDVTGRVLYGGYHRDVSCGEPSGNVTLRQV